MEAATIISLISAVVAPFVAYITVSRKMSGKVRTSEASDLWRESSLIREEYRTRLKEAEDKIMDLTKENNDLHRQVSDLMTKVAEFSLLLKEGRND